MVENVQAFHKIEEFGEPDNKKDNGGNANISAADSYKHFVENQRNGFIGELEPVIIEELADISEISGPNLNKNETQTVIIEGLTDISEMSGPNSNSVSNITTNELTAESIEKLKESHQIKLFDNQEKYNQLVQKSEKNTQCYICKTNFFSEENLVKHFSLVHEGEKPYQCNLCDVKFKGKVALKKHLSTIHVGKIFNCPECQKKSFYRKDCLKKHLESCLKKQSKKKVLTINEKKTQYSRDKGKSLFHLFSRK